MDQRAEAAVPADQLSFHTYRGLVDAERIAHGSHSSRPSVLIAATGRRGSDRCGESADLTIRFRRPTGAVSADIRAELPCDTRGRLGEPWFGLDPLPGSRRFPYATPSRAVARRRIVTPQGTGTSQVGAGHPGIGPRLDQLHGLGEARHVAEDLIGDIRSAQSGQIPWSAVDRGLLLIGAPGTGKTTLARAIAKECGVKFIVASAAKWQSAGALDAHLSAMRATSPKRTDTHRRSSSLTRSTASAAGRCFRPKRRLSDGCDQRTARADPRDKYDGLCHRDRGHQLSGKGRPGVAAGRAPRSIVEIPLPNLDGLQQIFEYYLAKYRQEGGEVGELIPARWRSCLRTDRG